MIGVVLAVGGALALWKRRDLYWLCQFVVRYPQRGVVYFAVQFALPVLVVVVGIALMLYPITGW